MTNAPDEAEVLVVGAGPTGLMMAVQLARRGVRPRIIDRNAGPSLRTKALGVQARTLEIYSKLGLAQRAIELGTRATGANMWARGRRAARVPLGDIGQDLSPFPFVLILGQDDNERLLGEALRELGVEIEWQTELVGLRHESGGERATLSRADGSRADVLASWVAGCDGAHSAVRHLSGIDFVGAPYEHEFYVADTCVTGAMVPDELNIYLWPGGFHLFFPMRGENRWRVVGIVPAELRERADRELSFDDVRPSICGEVGPSLQFESCNWFATYRIHHRRAAQFRAGPCFLLGDAAHIHSPVGAQGMNTGLQDAYNLAWKLALVVRGRADERLLETYASERVPVARRLLSTTDRAFSLAVSENWLAGFVRTRIFPKVLAFAMTRERVRQRVFRTISQTGIRYPESSLSAGRLDVPRDGPQPGDRFPWMRVAFSGEDSATDVYARLDDRLFNLVLVGQESAEDTGFGGLLAVHRVPLSDVNRAALRVCGIEDRSYFLVRPDGHIGLMGSAFDGAAIERYMRERACCRMSSERS